MRDRPIFSMRNSHLAMLFAALALMAAAPAPAAAQPSRNSIFTVENVHVDVTAENAELAKFNALRQGRREAITVLLRRLTPSGEWPHLPIIEGLEPEEDESAAAEAALAPFAIDGAAEAGALQPDYLADLSLESLLEEAETGRAARSRLDDERLMALEAGIELRNEQNSATRYLADITYAFKPDGIRDLLRDEGIPYSEVAAPLTLLLPVLEVEGRRYLWEGENEWAEHWRNRPTDDLTTLAVPFAELENILDAPVDRVMAGDAAVFAALAARYGVDRVLVAYAAVEDDGLRQRVRARLIDAYDAARRSSAAREFGEGGDSFGEDLYDRAPFAEAAPPNAPRRRAAAGGARPLGGRDQDSRRVSGDQHDLAPFAPAAAAFPRAEDILAERLIEARFSRIALLLEEAQGALRRAYGDSWKTANLINHGEARRLMASAYFRSGREWLGLRRSMVESPIVENVHVAALSRDGAFVAIDFLGGADQLRDMLARNRYEMWSEGGVWRIASVELAAQLRRNEERPRRLR